MTTDSQHQANEVVLPTKRKTPVDWRTTRDRADGLSLGIEMAASLVLGWYLGKLFDDHFASAPWGMVFFLVAGAGSALKAVLRFYRNARRVMNRPEAGAEVAAAIDARNQADSLLERGCP